MSMSEIAYEAHARSNLIAISPNSILKYVNDDRLDVERHQQRLIIKNVSAPEIFVNSGFNHITELHVESECPLFIDISAFARAIDTLESVYIRSPKGLVVSLPSTETIARRVIIDGVKGYTFLSDDNNESFKMVQNIHEANCDLSKVHESAIVTLNAVEFPTIR